MITRVIRVIAARLITLEGAVISVIAARLITLEGAVISVIAVTVARCWANWVGKGHRGRSANGLM